MNKNVIVDENGIIEVDIPQFILDEAKLKSEVANVENKFSIYEGESNKFVNYLSNVSEMMFGYVFPEAIYESTIHYDFIWYGKKVDIKCKKCAFKPYQNFYASVLESQYNRQKNEVYVFVRVKDDFTKCWILGAYKKEDYKRDAILSLKGKKNNTTGYVTKENSLDLPISKLTKLGKYIKG